MCPRFDSWWHHNEERNLSLNSVEFRDFLFHVVLNMEIIGIKRASRFSPNSGDRDAAILQAVASHLTRSYRHSVHLVDEQELTLSRINATDAIFSMARSRTALDILAEAEHKGIPVFNSAQGLQLLSRRYLKTVCEAHGIAVSTHLPEKGTQDMSGITYPCWLKRDDGCAQQADDVRFITDEETLADALRTFRERGIREYILEAHQQGDLLKFYGVAGTNFFHCHYPTAQNGFSKFGLESINGKACGFAFDRKLLKQQADRLGEALSVPIYGGDAIIAPDGTCRIIDFNDWPSFSICREEAAQAIARVIHERCTNR